MGESSYVTQVFITSLNNWDPGSIWAPHVGQDGPKTKEKRESDQICSLS